MFELKLTLEELAIIEGAMRARIDLYENTKSEQRIIDCIRKALTEKFDN